MLIALAFPAAASANVRLVSVSSAVKAGSLAQVTVMTFVHAQCTIKVHFGAKPPLAVPGLGGKGTLFGGVVQWRWKMPTNAARGRWTIDVSCGTAGKLRTYFSVR
jgi:hypothetical protein